MEWLKKNLKWITWILFALFIIKSIQSCNRKLSNNTLTKNYKLEIDSLTKKYDGVINLKDIVIDSLENELITKEFIIKDLTADLKIAGVKVDEAQRRADAIQRTAEKVKSNTTIEIKGTEKKQENNN